TFDFSQPNPLVACNGDQPNPEEISRAAAILSRDPFYTDHNGFDCEIIAATINADLRRFVYVESRAKKGPQFVNVTIKIHFVDSHGSDFAVDIESYNPFFGCDVRFIGWINNDVALLIYREKHHAFVYRVGDAWPPVFAKIDDRWQ